MILSFSIIIMTIIIIFINKAFARTRAHADTLENLIDIKIVEDVLPKLFLMHSIFLLTTDIS